MRFANGGEVVESCSYCGKALSVYGWLNGVFGPHVTLDVTNIDVSGMCPECRKKELSGTLGSQKHQEPARVSGSSSEGLFLGKENDEQTDSVS